MTVCIAAVASRDRIVCIADQLLTLHAVDKFEPDLAKLYMLGRSTVVLFAGNATIASEIVAGLVAEFSATWGPPWKMGLTVAEIAEKYKQAYADLKRRRIETEALAPFGLTLTEFTSRGTRLRSSVEGGLWARIDRVERAMGDNAAIIAGVNKNGGPDLYLIEDETATCVRSPGFACIGSGENHARTEMVAVGYDVRREQGEVMLMGLAAKRRAQLATGVGDKTHICVCGPESDAVRFLTNVDKGALGKLYEDHEEEMRESFANRLRLAQQTYGSDLPLMLPIDPPGPAREPQSPSDSTHGP